MPIYNNSKFCENGPPHQFCENGPAYQFSENGPANMVHLIIQGPKGPPNLKKIYSLKFSEKMSTAPAKLSSRDP